jgi:hypothetical protein
MMRGYGTKIDYLTDPIVRDWNFKRFDVGDMLGDQLYSFDDIRVINSSL